jgi:hypothetical protein
VRHALLVFLVHDEEITGLAALELHPHRNDGEKVRRHVLALHIDGQIERVARRRDAVIPRIRRDVRAVDPGVEELVPSRPDVLLDNLSEVVGRGLLVRGDLHVVAQDVDEQLVAVSLVAEDHPQHVQDHRALEVALHEIAGDLRRVGALAVADGADAVALDRVHAQLRQPRPVELREAAG